MIVERAAFGVLHGHEELVYSVAFSPDGKRIVSGSYDNTVKVWDAESGSELITLKGHKSGVRSVVFSFNGKRIISGSLDGTIRLWDISNPKEVAAEIEAEEKGVSYIRGFPSK